MASSTCKFVSVIAVMMVIAIVSEVELANASSLTVWSGPGCNNRVERYSKCGCSGINLHGGYEFTYNGQTASVYNQPGCSGVSQLGLGANAKACNPFGWKSIFIQC